MQIARIHVAKIEQVVEVDAKWLKLIQLAKGLPYSEMTVRFRDGVPYEAHTVREDIKF